MKPKTKKTLLFVSSVLVAFVVAEITLQIYSRLRHGASHWSDKITQRQSYASGEGAELRLENPNRTWENKLELHPLFGYVLDPKLKGVNNYGFACAHDFVLTPKGYCLEGFTNNSIAVIGVFGGSFAYLTARQSGHLIEDQIAELFPGRKPMVVNFALGGHALPQSAFIFLYFRNMVDVAMFIDGVNEPWNYVENNLAGHPPEFAKAGHFDYRTSVNELTPERFRLTQDIVAAQNTLRRATRLSLLQPTRHLMLSHYLWKGVHTRCERKIAEAMARIKRSYFESAGKFHDISDEEVVGIAVTQWKKYHMLVRDICKQEGILDIHVLQPSPYVLESKHSLTVEEKAILERDTTYTGFAVRMGYKTLKKCLKELRSNGALTIDLSQVFVYEDQQVWRDPWHVNEYGGGIVGKAICKGIRERNE